MPMFPAGSPSLFDVAIANPAAGAEWSYTVPDRTRLRLLYGRAFLTTSATAASRVPELKITSSAGILWLTYQGYGPSASQTWPVAIMPNLSFSDPIAPRPQDYAIPNDCYLAAGDVIESITTAIQAGDQWSQIVLRFQHWLEP